MPELRLHPNIQFIYELVLARQELESLGVKARVSGDLRSFGVEDLQDVETLKKRLAYFATVDGGFTDYHFIQSANRTRSVNQYLTHWIYPYKGKYHPQMIRALFNILGLEPGQTVLDPFIGSGTTAVEASLMGLRCVGVDVSPLCVLISRVKSRAVDIAGAVSDRLDSLGAVWSVAAIQRLAREDPDPDVRDFFHLALMVTESDVARRGRDFDRSLSKNTELMTGSAGDFARLRQELDLKLGEVTICRGDARKLDLPDQSIDAVVTSPPYSIALDYVQNDAHALQALGYDLEHVREDFIGVRGEGRKRFDLYNGDMELAYREMGRVLKSGSRCVVVLGNVTLKGEEVDTVGAAVDACRNAGLRYEGKVDKIIYGLYSIMQKEYILFFRKP